MTLTAFACKMRRRMSIHPRLVALALASTLLTGACGGPRTPAGLVVYTADAPELSMASVDSESGSWESAPWRAGDTGWLPYPPRGQLQLEHGLGRIPQTVIVYLSFDRAGMNAAQASGNLARVVEVDASTLTVWNDSNGSYFARVVAY